MIKALIVDDEKLVRKGMVAIMPWKEYDIEVVGDVNDGEKALEFLANYEVNLLITDISMPEMSGMELIETVRRLYPSIYIVILTFHQDFDFIQEALRKGVIDYILKTQLEKEELGNVLDRIVSRIKKDQIKQLSNNNSKDTIVYQEAFKQKKGLLFISFSEKDFDILNQFLWFSKKQLKEVIQNCWFLPGIHEDKQDEVDLIQASLITKGLVIVKVYELEDIDTDSVIMLLRDYIEQDYFYEYSDNNRICRLNLKQFCQQDNFDHVDRVHKLSEKWHTTDWIFNSELLEQLVIETQNLRPPVTAWEAIFYSVKNEWEYTLPFVTSHKPMLNKIAGLKFWEEWTDWIRGLCKLIQEEVLKPQYSKEIITSIMKSIEYVNQNEGVSIRQEDIAKYVNMSRSYFSICFKNVIGKPFNDYIKDIKLKKAQVLLAQTQKPIYWIAEKLGYQDEKYFSRMFFDNVGLLPTEFRNKKKPLEN